MREVRHIRRLGGGGAARVYGMTTERTAAPATVAPAVALLVSGVLFVALNLRAGIAALAPLLGEVRAEFGISRGTAGLLTTVPVVCFGALSPVAVLLGRRLGSERAVLIGLLGIAAGSALRAVPVLALTFAGTALIGASITIGNVLLPTLVKQEFGARSGAVTGMYTAAMTGGAALAAAISAPIAGAAGGDGWRAALAVWALPALAALAVLGAALIGDRTPSSIQGRSGGVRALLRDRLAWQVTLYMGLQSLVFYAGLAWLAPILRDDGYSAGAAGALLAVYALGGIPSAAVVPVLAQRMRDQKALAAAVCALEGLGLLGLLLAPDAALASVAVLALGQGGAFSLALVLMVLRAPDARVAADLSGMAQGFGYALAALGPFAIGALDDWSGSWDLALGALVAATVPLILVGIQAGRARTVGAPEGAHGP